MARVSPAAATPRWSPARLPRIRTALAQTMLGTTSQLLPPDQRTTAQRIAHQLRASELYWVSEPMTYVALDASGDLPEWTPAAALPAPIGMVAWQEGLPRLPLDIDQSAWLPSPVTGLPQRPTAPVMAVSWSQHGGLVHLLALTRMHDLATPAGIEVSTPGADSTLWPMMTLAPLDATRPIAEYSGPEAGLIAALGATWILMQTPTVATPRVLRAEDPDPHGRIPRRLARTDVSIIDLRRLDYHRDEKPDDEPSGRQYTHRWVVRGHWRQQAVGPGRSERRPTWIPSYIKGPDDAPLLATEHVHVWRR